MDREEAMRSWDMIREYLQEDDFGSLPRDIFESIIDGYEEDLTQLRNENKRLYKIWEFACHIINLPTTELEGENERLQAALKELLSEAVILSESYLEAFNAWPDDATIQGWDKARWKRALAAAKKARQVLNAEGVGKCTCADHQGGPCASCMETKYNL